MKKLISGNNIPLIAIAAMVILLVSLVLTKDNTLKNSANIVEFTEGVHYSKVTVPEDVSEKLGKLGYDVTGTFELFSYTCPHCYQFEDFLKAYKTATSDPVAQIQLGMPSFPVAQAHYIASKVLPEEELKAAKTAMYEVMISPDIGWEAKVDFAREFPQTRGISGETTQEIGVEAEEFASLSRELMIALDLQSTPSLYLHGQYLVNMREIGSLDNLIALSAQLRNK